jgi:hypothetical protein
MAGTGASSPFIKDEPEDQLFSTAPNSRFMSNGQQGFNMPQQHYNQFGTPQTNSNGSINPSELSMGGAPMSMQNGSYMSSSFHGNFGSQAPNSAPSYAKGISTLDEDDLLAGLAGHDMNLNQPGGHSGSGHDPNGFNDLIFDDNGNNNMFPAQPVDMNQSHLHNGYSSTPDGNPIQSPFVYPFNQEAFRQMQTQNQFGQSLQSPASYNASPFSGDVHSGSMDNSYMTAKPRSRIMSSSSMQRKGSSTRSPLTPKTPGLNVGSLNIGSGEPSSFPTQPIRTSSHSHRHQKTPSGQWDATPSSMNSVFSSELSSPIQQGIHPNPQISEVLKSGHHASLPAKVSNGHHSGNSPALQSQEMKRRRRRESHNLVERRRRDNINERIQELSHLVPMHRLEDEKVRKHLQNNSPLSPTLGGLSMSPPQATSGLAGPGARRATAGNITTGIPVEEKDKGPNKGDILNGAVSWTRDLMWMLHVKMQQQEELANLITELGGSYPFEQTEDERRMQTELMDALQKNNVASFNYSRAPGTGLRVPKHTDLKGDPLGGNQHSVLDATSMSPDAQSTDSGQAGLGVGGPSQYWSAHNSGGSGAGSVSFKEEDEYGMDLTQ